MLWKSLVIAAVSAVCGATTMEDLEGTWVSKSNTVFTGPGFYDPVDELLIEPDLPGISYSFTKDGHYEEALYRVVSNPVDHRCPTGSITYQHGTYELLSNGSMVLHPIAVDGRQLISEPCGNNPNSSTYVRYYQPTNFREVLVYVSAYHGRQTLQIFQFDGSKMQPLYLAYKPPMMLPTETLNPTNSDAGATASATDNGKRDSLRDRVKRSLENQYRTTAIRETTTSHFDKMWWIAVGVLASSSFAFFML